MGYFLAISPKIINSLRVLLLDNYDSFTYNLFHYLRQLTPEVRVARNDEITLAEALQYHHILISPGPGLPAHAGITMPLLRSVTDQHSVLGVCLGCQALGEVYGASLFNQQEVAHGIQRKVYQTRQDSWLFKGLPDSFQVGLYHSWAIEPDQLSRNMKITARSEKGIIMGMEHETLPVAGVQFHPESIMTEHGLQMLKNWLER
tara:strand:+ start:843 stop:1451 length:609 start_codon:yes stop_codon:yes gene_type:complete